MVSMLRADEIVEASVAAPRFSPRRRRLGEVLVEHGAITPDQLEEALAIQRDVAPGERRRRLGAVVVQAGFATETQVADALAGALGLQLVDLGTIPLAPEITRTLPRTVAQRHMLLPIARTEAGGLIVASADPTNVVALDDVRLYTKAADITVVVTTESQLRDHIARSWSLSEDSSDVATMFEDAAEEEDDDLGDPMADNAPVVRLVNAMLADAVRAGASDIHVEPGAAEMKIRYRIDGLLRDVMTVPRSAAAGVVSRIKVMSSLDIAERRVPQDGRTRISIEGTAIDCRISTLPSLHGEKVVIRLLARADRVAKLAALGLDEDQLGILLGTLAAPQGLVLITGPTGSGKTNTLYSAIHEIRSAERNIVTLEDPVEIQLAGITQTQVHERAGLTFARGLRSILRQDPDIILVGEVRDTETAKLALESALTGHLVLTTLHTNSAPAALTRLVDMGVEPFLVASSLSLVVAQRLVRRVCDQCSEPYTPAARTITGLGLTPDDLEGATPRKGRGCTHCGGTGYRGRVGVYEMLPVTAHLRSVLLNSPTETAVAAAARSAGMTTLRGSALAKARAGITTYDEVLRVTHVDSTGGAHCPSCERGLAEDMVVCPWCGTAVNRGHCESCARPLDPEWIMCPWCRTEAPTTPRAVVTPARAREATRLLVVDDDRATRSYVTTTLAGVVDVHAVGTVSEALAHLAGADYQGVLVDAERPGLEVVRLLRASPATAHLPVAVTSSAASADQEAAALAAGADDYLAKPIEPDLLEERITALLKRSR